MTTAIPPVSGRDARSDLELFRQVAASISARSGRDEVLKAVVSHVADVFGVLECHLFLLEDGRLTEAVSHGTEVALTDHTADELMEGITGWVIHNGVGTVSPNVLEDERNRGRARERAMARGPVSVAVVPIHGRGEVLGTLTILSGTDVLTRSTVDLRLLEIIAAHAGAAIVASRVLAEAEEARAETEKEHARVAELLESREWMVSRVAHELRNAVASAQMALRMMSGEPDEDRELTDLALTGAEDAMVIVNELLGNTTASPPTAVPLDLASVVRRLGTATGLPVEGTETPIRVMAVPTETRQILRNLVDNARRYGGSEITVSAGGSDEIGWAAVRDDGPGVTGEVEARLFEEYSTSGVVVEGRRSLGLGLAVSRKLARGMGGDLVYRRVAETTEFVLSLPTAPVD